METDGPLTLTVGTDAISSYETYPTEQIFPLGLLASTEKLYVPEGKIPLVKENDPEVEAWPVETAYPVHPGPEYSIKETEGEVCPVTVGDVSLPGEAGETVSPIGGIGGSSIIAVWVKHPDAKTRKDSI